MYRATTVTGILAAVSTAHTSPALRDVLGDNVNVRTAVLLGDRLDDERLQLGELASEVLGRNASGDRRGSGGGNLQIQRRH